MKIKDIIDFLDSWAHPSLQETYDNSGLLIGEANDAISKTLITLDITEEVIDESIALNADLIIVHHPFIFKGIKHIGNTHWIDRCIRKAIKQGIAIYAIHTNLDNVSTGVNHKIAEKIGLSELSILQPKKDTLSKLTIFVPSKNKEEVLTVMYTAGAGTIGNYDHCSFSMDGIGSFRGNESSNPTIGIKDHDEYVKESRLEVMVPNHALAKVLSAAKSAHPYEEVAYYVSALSNQNQEVGSGMVGKLDSEMDTKEFLARLKTNMKLNIVRYTKLVKDTIKKVAICGGSGSFLLQAAKNEKADIFITSDFKYHDFFEANDQLIIADIGHYESEVFTKELLFDMLTKNFTESAFYLSKIDTNPIKYL